MALQQIETESAGKPALKPALKPEGPKELAHNRRMWVLACMDERLPVQRALGIRDGDAHIFRNAGGLVTDDAIRSAMLTTQFFGTTEIVVVNHTECSMTIATGDHLTETLRAQGIDTDGVNIDPALPALKLERGAFPEWIRMFRNVDDTCMRQIELLRGTPLIPSKVIIHGYIWEEGKGSLRRPLSA